MGFNYCLNDLSDDLSKIIPQSKIKLTMPSEILNKATELIETKYKFEDWNLKGKKP
jgi:hypothetical protein